ncbi:hypothetical protein PSH84_04940 [Pseudomonas beijingensis]|uniref:hypothetical protein n=1 Tax=Pseudomonas beijingensis TaxID=2954101 RepID=UPI002735F3B0|nr:hypothetical protein [Pseudomonas sp. FP830]WLI46263.1 hypothetical protein PSH84_04940 [Pseudomonas sp. FP830]
MVDLVIVRSVEMFYEQPKSMPSMPGQNNRYRNERREQPVSGVQRGLATGSVAGAIGRVNVKQEQVHDVRTFDGFWRESRVAWPQQWSYNHSKSTEVLDHFSRSKPGPRNLSKKTSSLSFLKLFFTL